ncbi:transcriptional regulator [Lacrimispora sphenoides]|nr:transcriptional regulator [Lacrimispora sphenoides]
MEEMVDNLLNFESQNPPLYMLSNKKQINGAGCILYDGCLKDFADSQNSDVVILPSSTREVILVPDDGKFDYGELRKMVGVINES